MSLQFKGFSRPSEYSQIYMHDFEELNKFGNEPAVREFIRYLSKFSKINSEIILLSFKRAIFNSLEFSRLKKSEAFRLNFVIFLYLRDLIVGIYDSLKFKSIFHKKRKIDIILDSHERNFLDNFYSTPFVHELRKSFKVVIIPFVRFPLIPMRIADSIKSIPYFIKSLFLGLALRRRYRIKIELNLFLRQFFIDTLVGRFYGDCFSPKLVISGNDNGFSPIFAKASFSKLMLIQNGKRIRSSDGAFKYADYYVAMELQESGTNDDYRGCIFKEIFNYGSMRLAKVLKSLPKQEVEYDILWVSDLVLKSNTVYFSNYNHYFPMENVYLSTKLINEFARNTSLKIAYQTRIGQFEDEMRELKELNLLSDKLIYIDGKKQSTYISILRSEVILSCFSTVVGETLGLGKKGGFINLSGNQVLNYTYKEMDNEYSDRSGKSLGDFINRMKYLKIPKKFQIQNPNFHSDLMGQINKIIHS